MAETYSSSRVVAPFFVNAINEIYQNPNKQMFIMDGAVGVGKTSNFLIPTAYALAKDVVPIKRANGMIRESLWLAIREAENSLVATLKNVIQDALFSPDIVAHENSPVVVYGSHPTFIKIEHQLPDKSILKMVIECMGFNNPASEGRLRSRDYLGCIIPEIQTIPWYEIAELARQRTGRWNPTTTRLERVIDGKLHVLSGAQDLSILLGDANIPPRPHPMYDVIYDQPDLSKTIYHIIRPPSPLIPKPIEAIKDQSIIDKYPNTRYGKKDVVWLPNPEAYAMTRHYERALRCEITGNIIEGKTEPWSGYDYWYSELHQSESIICRHILGIPDSRGGAASVYKNFDSSTQVKHRALVAGGDVYIGYDPGLYGAFSFMQIVDSNKIHIFHEIIFCPDDGLLNENQIKDFVVPYCERALKGCKISVVVDPSGNRGNGAGEGAVYHIKSSGLKFVPCLVPNQDTTARRDCLGYYIDTGFLTVDPSCVESIKALVGGYRYKTTRSGIVSSAVDKNESSHIAEAIQYPAVNIYKKLVSKKRNGGKLKLSKIVSSRR